MIETCEICGCAMPRAEYVAEFSRTKEVQGGENRKVCKRICMCMECFLYSATLFKPLMQEVICDEH